MNRMWLGIAAAVALVFMMIVTGSFYTVDEGERAVVLRAGEYSKTVPPGFQTKMPFIDRVVPISIREAKLTYELRAISSDQQFATVRVSMNYRVSAADEGVRSIYDTYGNIDGMVSTLLSPQVSNQIGIVFGQFTAEASTKDRAGLTLRLSDAIRQGVQTKDENIFVESFQVELVDFSPEYKQSMEERALAEVGVSTARQNLARAQVGAQITVANATAEADSIRVKGQAEADAIAARGQALNDNPNLVELVQAERWDGVLPTTMVPSGATPIIGLK